MNICYLVGAGENDYIPSPDKSDLIIAADGGYDFLNSHGVRCDLLIGDLDSIKEIPKDIEAIRHKVEKDETDMHLAYLLGKERGYSDFVILGGMGGRADHTFANYSLLLFMANDGSCGTMLSGNLKVTVIKDRAITLIGNSGATFSVFAIGNPAYGVDITGAKYEARGVDLSCDFPLGVSNSFLSCDVNISVKNGALLIMQQI